MPSINTSRNLELLQRLLPGQAVASLKDVARVRTASIKTIQNEVAAGTFPVRTIKIGRRRVVSILDLADYLDSLTTPAPGPGRPRNTREGV
jgi:hypothetical protein